MTGFAAKTGRTTSPQEIVERVLKMSRADRCLVIAEESSSANLRWANNALTSNGSNKSGSVTVIAAVDGAIGSSVGVASQVGVTDQSLEALTRRAEAAARSSMPAEDAQHFAVIDQPSHNWNIPPAETSFRVFDSFVTPLAEAMSVAGRERKLFGYADHKVRSTFLGSSQGLRKRCDRQSGYIQLNMRSPAFTESVWAGKSTLDFADVTVAELYDDLKERFAWTRKPQIRLQAGRYETLLSPSAVADLMICLYESAGARDALDGRSVFSNGANGTRVGERLSSAKLTLRSDPSAPGMACAPFVLATSSSSTTSVFDNGLPLEPTNWITDGILSALVQTRHSASQTGLPVTPRIDNLILEGPPDGSTLNEMIQRTARGLLVTSLWYIREVDPQRLLLTGVTRDGVFLIENGEIVGPVNNFRFNESPVGILMRVTESSRCERTLARECGGAFPFTAMPWLRVDQFNMSSVSEVS